MPFHKIYFIGNGTQAVPYWCNTKKNWASRLGRPFCRLAAAAVVVAAAVVAVVLGVAVAAAAEQQDQDDDPPAVAATETVITTHNPYLHDFLRYGLRRTFHVIPGVKKGAENPGGKGFRCIWTRYMVS